MSQTFNYKHLYYFWVVAQSGGMSRGAERLGMAVQTVSAQVRQLEQSLGVALLKPSGRHVVLTEAGQAALRQAEQIFQLGAQLPELVKAANLPQKRLSIGLSDGLPKMAAKRLMQPLLGVDNIRLVCMEGEIDDLLADLALHRLDLVLADRPAPQNQNFKLYTHALGSSALLWYAPPALLAAAKEGFPQSLARVPVLLPSHHNAARVRLDTWFDRIGVRPNIVGEFEDSALLKTFGAAGMGVFPATAMVEPELAAQFSVSRVGGCEWLGASVEEQFFGIAAQKKIEHPLVLQLLQTRQL
ncbi:LysR family transcriptional regulator [Variovorax sp. PCZ-1]|uniref:LysR family transcriptional regulator n=1 Tax=Variovorax sp. PCZ-1 TaxID=2835533 RepID=UPI001BCC0FB9|nr:LysR family transcriptional regulator [Variovorax sp. PCZ-1]MBS7808723.1 LysR family transcriptional regulator [Variovorax sp. PCZ-1]